MNKGIAVLGCGWLGLPLAISLIKEGYKVSGSTTSEKKLTHLKKQQIEPFLITLSEEGIQGTISDFLFGIDTIIINVPPKLRGTNSENYIKKIRLLHQEVKKSEVSKVIFVSSTSVYGDIIGDVTETSIPQPMTASGEQLLAAENIFKNDTDLKTTIIRFGGLIGPNRHPITTISGRQGLSNGNAPVNLIHLNDCIRIISCILKHSWWNEVINGVHPEHPSKQKYYILEAQKRNLQIPDYKEDTTRKSKIIKSKVLIDVKKFDFTTAL